MNFHNLAVAIALLSVPAVFLIATFFGAALAGVAAGLFCCAVGLTNTLGTIRLVRDIYEEGDVR